jgi:hypothetical protein
MMRLAQREWVCFAIALAIMAGGAGLIVRMQAAQKLGAPGLRTTPLADSRNLQVELPESLPSYTSRPLPILKEELEMLPKDTSFGRREYRATDGFAALVSAVLMGTDRSSIHRPEFCLTGQGLRIDEQVETAITIARPQPYELPVMKLTATKEVEQDCRKETIRGIYVYWFVSGERLTARHAERMWWMAEKLLATGVLERWAYVSYFTVCAPGGEDAAFARLKELIVLSVPEYQLIPGNTRSESGPGTFGSGNPAGL